MLYMWVSSVLQAFQFNDPQLLDAGSACALCCEKHSPSRAPCELTAAASKSASAATDNIDLAMLSTQGGMRAAPGYCGL